MLMQLHTIISYCMLRGVPCSCNYIQSFHIARSGVIHAHALPSFSTKGEYQQGAKGPFKPSAGARSSETIDYRAFSR